MDIFADIAIGAGALLAAAYCVLLSRRLRAFTGLTAMWARHRIAVNASGPIDQGAFGRRGQLCRARKRFARSDNSRRTGGATAGIADGG